MFFEDKNFQFLSKKQLRSKKSLLRASFERSEKQPVRKTLLFISRSLAPLIDKVMENITQYFVPERDPWYNKGFQNGEEKQDQVNKREFTALFLISTDFPVEKIARLVERPVDYVEGIKKELTQIRILLETKNSITKTARSEEHTSELQSPC